MRVGQLGRDVEAEVLRVLDRCVAQPHAHHAPLLEGLLEEERLDGRVKLLQHVLQQHGRPELDGVFEGADKVGVGELDDLHLVLLLHVPEVLVRLALGVDTQRPAAGRRHDNAVVDREGVGREAVDDPLADLDGVAKHRLQRERVRARHLFLAKDVDPVACHRIAVPFHERAQVRDVPGRDEHVAREVGERHAQLVGHVRPPELLAAEALDELLGALQLHFAQRDLGREVPRLVLAVQQLGLERVEVINNDLQRSLLLREDGHRTPQLLLRGFERRLLGRDHLGDAVVGLHGQHPLAEALRRAGGLGDADGRERLVRHKRRADHLHHLHGDVVLVVGLERRQQRPCREELDSGAPVVLDLLAGVVWVRFLVRFHLQHNEHSFHRKLHSRRRLPHTLHKIQILLLDRIQRLERIVEDRDRLGKISRALILHFLDPGRLGGGGGLVLHGHGLLRLDRRHLGVHLGGQQGGLLLRDDQPRLQRDQLHLHGVHGLLRHGQRAQPAAVALDHEVDPLTLHA
mmetsp:Transcript_11094/g.26010  ORF Transcript_11094/g.26010 Transcript_11094/m.26010 type:complete len:516 (+) Transcript_11094:417-1964(+)